MSVSKVNTLKTINEIEAYRKEINEACDKRMEFVSACIKANEMSNKSFGFIKEAFEAISPELFKTAQGKKIINKYTATIKEDKNLSSLHSLYENIRKAGSESDINFFINSIASENWGVDKKTVDESCRKLGRVLAEGYLSINDKTLVTIPQEDRDLSNAVYFISENKKTTKNIADYSNAVSIIRERVEKSEAPNTIKENRDIDKLANSLLEEFNKKYSSELTETEIAALKELSESDDRSSVFEKYKSDCSNKLSEARKKFETENNSAAIERIDSIIEQISSKEYVLENVGNDICGMIKLSTIFG
jgi:hypothetical protein